MEQKTTYRHYLLIGMSSLTMSLSSCQQEIEYRLDTEFIFENQSDKTISFAINDPNSNRNEISLLSNTSDTIRYNADGGFENPNPNTCCEGLLNDILGDGKLTISVNDSICSISSPLKIDNYTFKKVDDRYFRYTFKFTNEVLDDLPDCQ